MSIKLPANKHVAEAVWTRRSNIVYSEADSRIVVTMSRSGDVIRQTNVFKTGCLSVSTNGVIYLIHKQEDVYQSTDEGLTWSHVFNVPLDWKYEQVIKVSTDSNTDVLWTSIWLGAWIRCLRVYTVDNQQADGDHVISQRDVAVPRHVSMDSSSKLVYDGHTSIVAIDNRNVAVLLWSVSGQYDRQLLSSEQLVSYFGFIGVDVQRQVMYIGHNQGRVNVFELTYEPL
jgi:hypothetical protein